MVSVMAVIVSTVSFGQGHAQVPCPQPDERSEIMVNWFLAALPAMAELDQELSSQVGLGGLTRDEVEVLAGEEDEQTCALLQDWMESHSWFGERVRYAFFKARDRYIVFSRNQLEPAQVRIGRYEDTFAAIFSPDLELIHKLY